MPPYEFKDHKILKKYWHRNTEGDFTLINLTIFICPLFCEEFMVILDNDVLRMNVFLPED